MIQELGFDPISAQFTRRDRYQVVKLEHAKGAFVNDHETTWQATKISSAKGRDIKTSEYNGTQYEIKVQFL